jgi:hypothetical protein
MGYSPPPFQPEAPKPKGGTGLAIGVSVLAVLLVIGMCGGLIWGAFSAVGSVGKLVSEVAQCPITFELTTNATLAYAKEHGGVLPKSETWQKDIAPYYERLRSKLNESTKDVPVFKFKAPAITDPLSCSFGDPVTGIWINKEVAGKKISDIKEPDTTVLYFEGEKIVMNGAGVYVEKKEEQSPKFMGERREWIKTMVSGHQNFMETSDKNRSFEFSVEDALTPKSEQGAAPAPPKAPAPSGAGN